MNEKDFILAEFVKDVEDAVDRERGHIYNAYFKQLPETTQTAVNELLLKQSMIILQELNALGVTPSFVMLGSGSFGSLHLTSELKKRDEVQSYQLNNKA